ncbi:MAG: M4 family metallopeptidase, partial [Bacteroidia bacterium]
MKNLYVAAVLAFVVCSNTNIAQNNNRLTEIANEYTYNTNKQLDFVKLKDGYSVYETSSEDFLNSMVIADNNTKVKKVRTDVDQLGFTHTRYQLYYNNTPVNNAMIIVHSRDGKVVSVNGDLAATQKPVNSLAISEAQGLQMALKKVSAKKYKWENAAEERHMKEVFNKPDFTFYPKGELILYTKQNKAKQATVYYAYKYNIYAEQPLYRANVIVDAQSGTILAEENLICTADVSSTANTKYSGVQTFTTDNVSAGSYRLRETGRGLGIETYNLNNSTTYTNTDFTYTSTTWPATAPIQTGTDAHWGAEKTYDYYMVKHSRNSIDGAGYKLLSYVHYSNNYNNAYWDGTRMTYGDGDGTTFTILTAIDVCGHEITHGLTNFTAGLNGGGTGEAGVLDAKALEDLLGRIGAIERIKMDATYVML